MWVRIFDKYEISDDGVIRNFKTKRTIKQFVGKDGYVRTQIAGKTRLVHRLVALQFLPFCLDKNFVNHIDGDKQNNSASNLEWCTSSENQKHAYRKQLRKPNFGVKNGRSKLSEKDVDFILSKYIPRDAEFGATALAERFGVARQTICAVAHGQNWRNYSENVRH